MPQLHWLRRRSGDTSNCNAGVASCVRKAERMLHRLDRGMRTIPLECNEPGFRAVCDIGLDKKLTSAHDDDWTALV